LTISWCLESSDGVVKNYHWSELQDGSWKSLLDFLIIGLPQHRFSVLRRLFVAVQLLPLSLSQSQKVCRWQLPFHWLTACSR